MNWKFKFNNLEATTDQDSYIRVLTHSFTNIIHYEI